MPIVDMQGTDLCLRHIYLSPSPVMATQYMIVHINILLVLWPNGNILDIII